MAQLVANARMYGVAPLAVAAWRALFTFAGEQAAVDLAVIEHAFPATLHDLWSRPDLGCAFMCGWPFALENGTRPIIAAPVPLAAWSGGAAVYRSDLIVSAASPFRAIEDAFGHRFAFNALGSHSGVNLPRLYLARFAARAPLFSELVGPLTTPRRCVEAVANGEADISAVDSYALDLLRRHDPALAARVRVIASTAPNPIPPLVGSTDQAANEQLRAALLALHLDPVGQLLLADLCLGRFCAVDRSDYAQTLLVAAQAARAGYPALA